MADKSKLQGSLGSLLDTLSNRFDPMQPEEVVGAWTSTMATCAACARNTSGWNKLAGQSADFDPPIRALNDATNDLVTADYSDAGAVNRALGAVRSAVGELAPLLA